MAGRRTFPAHPRTLSRSFNSVRHPSRRVPLALAACAALAPALAVAAPPQKPASYYYDAGRKVDLYTAGEDAQHRPVFFTKPDPAEQRRGGNPAPQRDEKDARTLTSQLVVK